MDIKTIKRFYNVNKLSVDEISKKVGFPKEDIEKVLFEEVEVAEEVEETPASEETSEETSEEVKEEAPVESQEEVEDTPEEKGE